MSKGVLYIISGPSGTGKGTICKELTARRDIYLSVSTTTRDIRPGEIPDVTYHYTTPDQFLAMIHRDEMLEWAVYGQNYYGTPRAAVQTSVDSGRDVILEIEPQGALKVKEQFPEAVMIFVVPPSMEVLRKRLLERGREDEQQIQERVEAARWEFSQADKYNYIVVNDDLEECVSEVLSLMEKTRKDREKIVSLLAEY